jgi:hypothetical protein
MISGFKPADSSSRLREVDAEAKINLVILEITSWTELNLLR